jgi:hypothetical protein
MIRVPRAVFDQYYDLPYRDMELAAKAGVDGLRIANPKIVPWPNWYLAPPAQPKNDHLAVQESWRLNVSNWEHDVDHAYFREGTDFLSKGKALLYQQGW